ncbi:hypothetical protein HY213_00375 [Candidatus Peregrinibacteria bacterium]|nr:hypothetical protein [Candidatus Peregrinibacteria bacterium]
MEDAIYDRTSFQKFLGIDLLADVVDLCFLLAMHRRTCFECFPAKYVARRFAPCVPS